MVVMIYNWIKLEWTEYTEPSAVVEVTNTVEMQCAKITTTDDKIKIYVLLQKYSDMSRCVGLHIWLIVINI